MALSHLLGMAIVREVDRTSDGFRVKYRLDSPTVMRDTVSNTIHTYSRARGESGELCIDRPSAACVVIVECDEMPVETIKLTPKN